MIFDLGFGGYNFSWDVAEKAFAQDLVPHTISSDLQQYNVVRPVKSLANVMSAMMRLGYDAASNRRARDWQSGQGPFADRPGRHAEARHAGRHHGVPRQVRRIRDARLLYSGAQSGEADRSRSSRSRTASGSMRTSRWGRRRTTGSSRFAEDHVPSRASKLSDQQRAFLSSLAANLARRRVGGRHSAERSTSKRQLSFRTFSIDVRQAEGCR